MTDTILTIKEIAKYVKVNESIVFRLTTENKNPAFRVVNPWRFKQSDLKVWISTLVFKGKGDLHVDN